MSLILNYEVIRWWEVESATIVEKHAVITPIQNAEALKLLFQQLLRLPDEQTVRIVLGLPNE